jgi:hypothetical protein
MKLLQQKINKSKTMNSRKKKRGKKPLSYQSHVLLLKRFIITKQAIAFEFSVDYVLYSLVSQMFINLIVPARKNKIK